MGAFVVMMMTVMTMMMIIVITVMKLEQRWQETLSALKGLHIYISGSLYPIIHKCEWASVYTLRQTNALNFAKGVECLLSESPILKTFISIALPRKNIVFFSREQ